MTKQMARLEFKMPNSCPNCPFDELDDDYRYLCSAVQIANGTEREIMVEDFRPDYEYVRPDWCPLKGVTGND
jgi:hypothetical protein